MYGKREENTRICERKRKGTLVRKRKKEKNDYMKPTDKERAHLKRKRNSYPSMGKEDKGMRLMEKRGGK